MQPIEYSKQPQAWCSALPRTQHDITIVTQLSTDRLDRLEKMAASWAGVISAAVLLPPHHFQSQRRKMMQEISQMHQRVEALASCRLDISILNAHSTESTYDSLYPINALR